MLISPDRLSQKAGREQALPEDFVECGGKLSATPLWIVSDKPKVCRTESARRYALPAHSKLRRE